ncbi:ABC transporter substrate-binding protein [Pseudokineococcus marinus]
MSRGSRAAAAVVAAAALALTACAPSAPEDEASGEGGATGSGVGPLVVATTTDVVNFNPLIGNSRTDSWVTDLMYPRLLHIDEDGEKEAALATDWGYSDDLTGYFEIRDDMSWSDGEPITAEDVAWTLQSVLDDQPAGTLLGQMGAVESVEAVSDTRVELHLSEPDAVVVPEVGFWAVVVPQHVFEPEGSLADFANDAPQADGSWVSAGPYALTEVQRGQSYTMERVEDYPLADDGAPNASEVVFRVYPDVNTELLALESGEVDLVANALPPSQVERLRSADGIEVAEVPGLGYAHLVYNMDEPRLAQVDVRRALAAAVDYDTIREVVLQGQAVSAGSNPLIPVLSRFAPEDAEEYAFDPQAARDLMASAGVDDPSFRLLYNLTDPVMAQAAQLMEEQAAEAGITLELDGRERNAYLAATDAGDYDVYLGNFAIMDDPVTNFRLSYLPGGVINYTHVDDPELTALVEEAGRQLEVADQVPVMQEAAEIVKDQVYDNILYTQNLYIAHSDEWSGFVVQPSELLSVVNPVSLANATTAG